MISRKRYFWLSPIFSLTDRWIICCAVILFVSLSCSEEKVKPQIGYTIEEQNFPVQESWNSKIYFSEDGELKAILYTDHLKAFEQPPEKLLDNVRIEFLDGEQQISSVLTSKRGKVDDNTENMFAIDSVVAVNDSSKIRLETDELMWRKSDQKIVSDKFVRITSPEEIIEGYGFESDRTLKNYVIYDITYQTILKKNDK